MSFCYGDLVAARRTQSLKISYDKIKIFDLKGKVNQRIEFLLPSQSRRDKILKKSKSTY
jgi:porphobilinogen deaminase